jgi:PHP domain-containing protein
MAREAQPGPPYEAVINLHMHTTYSDGTGSHQSIAAAAMQAGLDAVIVTDHNVLVQGPEAYYKSGKKRVLLLVGEEVHDQARLPQKSHLLVFGAGREMATYAENPQTLIDQVIRAGGICFIAHPHESSAPSIHEDAITWENWEVQGFTGLELWNGLSEIKTLIPTILHAIFYAYFPRLIPHGPPAATLSKWDELLAEGKRVYSVGGSDAHELKLRAGPLKRTVFPYLHHFSTINTHLLLPEPLSGELAADRRLILDALGQGNSFTGYDLPASTRGFRFTAQGKDAVAIMGGEIAAEGGVTLQVRLPQTAEGRLIQDGQVIKTWQRQQIVAHTTSEPGAYRVEAFIPYYGKRRGWIYSNPIFVRAA